MDRDRASAEYDGGVLTVRASALGGCENALAWVAKGGERTPPPEFMQRAMDESASLEDRAMEQLADDQGWLENYFHPDPGKWVCESYRLTGGTDFYHSDEDFFVEIKCVGENTFEELCEQMERFWPSRTGLAWKYTWQLAAYQHIHGERIVLGLAEKDANGLTGRVRAFVDLDLPGTQSILDRLSVIEDRCTSDELKCDGQSGWCEAEQLCRPEPVELDLDIEVNLIDVYKREVAAAEAKLREVREQVEAQVREVGGRAVTREGHKLTWVETHVVEKKPREYDRRYLKITRAKVDDG